jgi:acyl-CoA synthetase (AMP-forming)/AMP-acid ligase II
MRAWLTDPRTGRGVHLATDTDDWEYRSYAELASGARRAGAAMVEEGVRPGDVVCVIVPTGFVAVEALFGAWAAGATACFVTPPAFAAAAEYVGHVAGILAQARPALTVASPPLTDLVDQAIAEAGLDRRAWALRHAATEAPCVAPGRVALLQFTSGSHGSPRGVQVTWRNLEINTRLMLDWLGWRDGDSAASWLPLYHDLGLIGGLLTPVTAQGDLWLMRPDQFIRDPMRWVRCLTVANHTGAPSFGYRYAARRIRTGALSELDLSGLRTAVVGAEPIDPVALTDFARLAAAAGFSPSAYVPAYGLAEATLGASADTARTAIQLVLPDPATLRVGERVRVLRERRLDPAGGHGEPGWLVGCGLPAQGGLRIVGTGGATLPEGCFGEIVLSGGLVTAGYLDASGEGATRFVGDELRTGDGGFFHAGHLFVIGRMGDSMKIRGRSVHLEDLETRVVAATGLPRERCVAIGTADAVTLVVERPEGPWIVPARRALHAELGDDVEIRVVAGRPGLIHRTSSGKPRRRHMWELFRTGALR